MPDNYFVYILTTTKNTTLYVGVTNDLKRRVYEHRSGLTPGFTKRYNVKKLVYYECLGDPEAAIVREKQLKAGSRAGKVALIEGFNPDWVDLYPGI